MASERPIEEVLRELFPELTLEDIRVTLTRATERRRHRGDPSRLPDPVAVLIAKARQHAGLSDEEAMELAVQETRAARAERAHRAR